MTINNESFFAEMQGAAIMKHRLLGPYIRIFAQKLGKTSAGGKVVYVDGYAGPGRYEDGSPGSPLIAAEVANLLRDVRNVQCFFIEKDPAHVATLEHHLATALPTAVVVHGAMEEYIDGLIEVSRGRPMLAFIDPFGLGISYDSITKLATRKDPTDLILNVSLSGVRRNAGHLSSAKDYKAKPAFVARLDKALGGDWWQPMWLESNGAEKICEEFCSRAAQLRNATIWSEVRDRWEGPIAYYLLLITGHPDGLWHFAENLSHAHDALRAADPQGEPPNELFPPLPLADVWQQQIEANIVELLAEREQFTIQSQLGRVYGSTLGYAREMHLRKAIKSLYAKGATSTIGKGPLQRAVIAR